jgi:hypothetical protein
MNFPSGGTKLISPGCSFHRLNRTQGWKTGSCIVLLIPADLLLLVPPEAVRIRSKSGTPEILAVNKMEPLARADISRPEGVKIMERDSMMST